MKIMDIKEVQECWKIDDASLNAILENASLSIDEFDGSSLSILMALESELDPGER